MKRDNAEGQAAAGKSVRRMLLLALCAMPLAICLCYPFDLDEFSIRVVSPDGAPIVGATVRTGLVDWGWVSDETDADGWASMTGRTNGNTAFVTKDNYYSTEVRLSPNSQYVLRPTPESLRRIGNVLGKAILFDPKSIVTLDAYRGVYRVYRYDDSGVVRVCSTELVSPISTYLARSDTLWVTVGNEMHAYSLRDRRRPERFLRLKLPEANYVFYVLDGLLVTHNRDHRGPLRVYRYWPDGTVELTASAYSYTANKITIRSNHVVSVGTWEDTPVVISILDPWVPVELHHGRHLPPIRRSIFLGDYVVLTRNDSLRDSTRYRILDLTDPARPIDAGWVATDAWLDGFADESTAVGCYVHGGYAILRGSILGGLRTKAVIGTHQFPGGEYNGARPPYFLLGSELCKLERN